MRCILISKINLYARTRHMKFFLNEKLLEFLLKILLLTPNVEAHTNIAKLTCLLYGLKEQED